jgi:type I restriction enzyme M protein
LFIDARKMGRLIDRVHRELTEEDVRKIADPHHAWRGDNTPVSHGTAYEDLAGFCKAAKLEHIQKNGYVLTPGRYVGAAAAEDDGEPFEEKMARLTAQFREQTEQGRALDEAIGRNLEELGYGR